MRQKYRKDIDGLRGFAILLVVGFHAFPDYIKSGFIGVDIFFIISGFLITTSISSSFSQGNFSFLDFYSRRIKRIFPALITVLVAVFLIGWFTLFSGEYKQLGAHIAGSAAFISNFLLWHESGYFDNLSKMKPLLHLWSLAIEEQFYILWPLLLWATWRSRLNPIYVALALAIASFAINLRAIVNPAMDFYSPITRFWEVLLGSILALITVSNSRPRFCFTWPHIILDLQPFQRLSKLLRNFRLKNNYAGSYFEPLVKQAISFIGATILAVGLILIDKTRSYPGLWALFPAIGTALIIAGGCWGAWLNRTALESPILIWFGQISFPLYLWHWPLLSILQIVNGGEVLIEFRVAIILVSIILAWITYKFIESPIRFGLLRKSLATPIILVVLIAIVGGVGLELMRREGLPLRSAALLQREVIGDIGHEEFYQYHRNNFFKCTPEDLWAKALLWNDVARCFQSRNNEIKEIAIIGDSHAEHLFLGLAEKSPANIVYYIKNSLPYYANEDFVEIFDYVLSDSSIRTVIIAASWHGRLDELPPGKPLEVFLSATMKKLSEAGKKVYILDDVPNFPFTPEKCKYLRKFSRGTNCVAGIRDTEHQLSKFYPSILAAAKANPNVKVINISPFFCSKYECSMVYNNKLLFRDNGHLNINGSRFLAERILLEIPDLLN